MRVAFVAQPWNDLTPPVEGGSLAIWNAQMARQLAQRGHEVAIIARGTTGSRDQTYDGVAYRFVPAEPVDLGPDHRPVHWTEDFAADYQRGVARTIAAGGYDVVHIHNFANFAPAIRAARPQVRLLLNMQCDWLELFDLERTAGYLDAIDHVLACSRVIEQGARTRFPDAAMSVLPNAVDPRRFSIDARRRSTVRSLLFVGRLSPEKGVHTLCEAFGRIAPRHPRLRMRLAGPQGNQPRNFLVDATADAAIRALERFYGPEPYLETCLAALDPDARRRVRVTPGHVRNVDLPSLYGQADVLVNPSLWEPFGITILEGMATGCVAVGAAVGGMLDSIVDGESGFLCPRDEPAALADVLEQALEARWPSTIAQAGLDRALTRFSYDAVADQLERVCVGAS